MGHCTARFRDWLHRRFSCDHVRQDVIHRLLKLLDLLGAGLGSCFKWKKLLARQKQTDCTDSNTSAGCQLRHAYSYDLLGQRLFGRSRSWRPSQVPDLLPSWWFATLPSTEGRPQALQGIAVVSASQDIYLCCFLVATGGKWWSMMYRR